MKSEEKNFLVFLIPKIWQIYSFWSIRNPLFSNIVLGMTLFIAQQYCSQTPNMKPHQTYNRIFYFDDRWPLKSCFWIKNNFRTHIWFGSVLRRVFQIHSSYYAVVFNIISCSSRNSFKNIVIEGIRWGVMILLVFF